MKHKYFYTSITFRTVRMKKKIHVRFWWRIIEGERESDVRGEGKNKRKKNQNHFLGMFCGLGKNVGLGTKQKKKA